MNVAPDSILRRVLFLIVLQLSVSLSINKTKFNNGILNIVSKSKIELNSVILNCFLNDMVCITTPVINAMDLIYLSKPNGETIKIDLHILVKKVDNNKTSDSSKIETIFHNNSYTLSQQSPTYDVFQVKNNHKKLKRLKPNEFLVGPLLEEDHGNWILSIFSKDIDGEWIERFQSFTMVITELTTLEPHQPVVHIGDTFNLSFSYPLPAIELCEIVPPRSTFDRFYDRDKFNFNKCGFVVPNITKEDEGIWNIIGVGRIVYMGRVQLNVIDDNNNYVFNDT